MDEILKSCADIHRKLWYQKDLDIGDGYSRDPRDEGLLKQLASNLGIPDEKFITSDRSSDITAQAYLMAMLETLEPLSKMFIDIWNYCERSFTKRSQKTTKISWDFNINGEKVTIDFESFRQYSYLRNTIPSKPDFDSFIHSFLKVCVPLNQHLNGVKDGDRPPNDNKFQLSPKPATADSNSIPSRLHDVCIEILQVNYTEKGYTGSLADVIPHLNWLHSGYWTENFFYALKEPLKRITRELSADDILSLPFWRKRWHIYELWCLIKTLEVLEPHGYQVTLSPDGASVLELGKRNTVVAERRVEPKGQVIYQPSYKNYSGAIVQPDIAIAQGLESPIASREVLAIIECKQHKMPAQASLIEYKKKYFQDVAEKYLKAISPEGQLLLLNYDPLDFQRSYNLIDSFAPNNEYLLKQKLGFLLDKFQPIQSHVLVIDASESMETVRSEMLSKIRDLHSEPHFLDTVIWLSAGKAKTVRIGDVATQALESFESEELFASGLELAKSLGKNPFAHIVTDLADNSNTFLRLSEFGDFIEFKVHTVGAQSGDQ